MCEFSRTFLRLVDIDNSSFPSFQAGLHHTAELQSENISISSCKIIWETFFTSPAMVEVLTAESKVFEKFVTVTVTDEPNFYSIYLLLKMFLSLASIPFKNLVKNVATMKRKCNENK